MNAKSASTDIGREEQHAKYVVSSRRIVALGKDVHVKEFTLAPGEEVPWHKHTQMFDVFYCLEGRLEIDVEDAPDGDVKTHALAPTESVKVEAGTAHRPHNRGPGLCRFLIVQGVGTYDYLPVQPHPHAEGRR